MSSGRSDEQPQQEGGASREARTKASRSERVRRFEENAEIAWMLDLEGGYRGANLRQWKYDPVEKLWGGKPSLFRRWASLDVGQLAPDKQLPEILIEPAPDQTVRVTSSIGLAVQAYGDSVPRRAGRSVELPYGSVVRAGPILFSVVFEEQAVSLREGKMTLPFIGGGLDGGADRLSMPGLEPALQRSARRFARMRVPLAVVSLLLLVGLGVGLYVASLPETDPRKVLVIVDGVNEELADGLGDQLGGHLMTAGFEPEVLTASDVGSGGALLDGLDQAVEERLAGGVVVLTIDVVEERPGLRPEAPFLVVTATAHSRLYVPATNTTDHTITMSGEVGSGRDQLFADVGSSMIAVLSHAIVADLVRTTAGPEFFTNVEMNLRDDVIEDRRRAEDNVKARELSMRRYEESCDQAMGHLDVEQNQPSPLAVRPLSGPCEEEYPIGIAPDGSYAVVQVETLEPYFTLEGPFRVSGRQAPERIELVPLDGGERQTLAKARSFNGLGALAAGRVFVVETAGLVCGLVEIDIATRARRVLHLVDAPHVIRSSIPSPDGEWVFIWRQDYNTGPLRPFLLNTDGGDPQELDSNIRSLRWVEIELPAQDGDGSERQLLIAAETRRELFDHWDIDSPHPPEHLGFVDTLELIDPVSRRVAARLDEHDADHHVQGIAGVFDGTLHFQSRYNYGSSCSLGAWRPFSEESPTFVQLPHCVRYPRLTADGSIVARALVASADDPRDFDTEVVLVNRQTGAIDQLTENRVDERHIYTGRDTTHFVFGRVLPSHYENLRRVVPMVAEIEH